VRIPAAVTAGIAGFVLTFIVAHGRSTPYNNYVLFADSLLHGHLWIDWPGPYIDAVLFDGQRFIVNDPVPSILLLPFVAVFGLATNQTLLACVLAGVATGAAWSLFRRLGAPSDTSLWLTAFAFAEPICYGARCWATYGSSRNRRRLRSRCCPRELAGHGVRARRVSGLRSPSARASPSSWRCRSLRTGSRADSRAGAALARVAFGHVDAAAVRRAMGRLQPRALARAVG